MQKAEVLCIGRDECPIALCCQEEMFIIPGTIEANFICGCELMPLRSQQYGDAGGNILIEVECSQR